MRIGFIGLGKMGSRMVLKLLEEGHTVTVWNRSNEAVEEFKVQSASWRTKFKVAMQNLKVAQDIKELVYSLEAPRVIWLMLPAGDATEGVLKEVVKYIEKDDIVIDGGNAFYKDTERRSKELRASNIRYLGIGVSGGIVAAKEGYPLMAGGDKLAYEHVKPILDSLSKPHGGHEYFGQGGAGHFVKMVHNGMEYGIMQSLGEGFGILEKSPYALDLLKVAKLYQKGTLVSGFMLDRAVEVLSNPSMLQSMKGAIQESGEAKWTVETAKEQGVDAEIIERSLEFRKKSQTDTKVQNSFAAKMISALRNAFGGHSIKKK
jgi:6-phosphogluconate dehydrogenase